MRLKYLLLDLEIGFSIPYSSVYFIGSENSPTEPLRRPLIYPN